MFKRGFVCFGFIGLFAAALVIASSQANSAAASASVLPVASSCGAISCTVYLPVIFKPLPLITPQFEVTQGVQQPDNSVRLIAGRPVFVRWTLTSPTTVSNTSAYLVGSRDGVALSGSPLAAMNNSRTLAASANRAVLGDTFNFQLPASWADGTLSLSAYAVNSASFITTTSAQNFAFSPGAILQVKAVPIEYHCTSGGSGTTTSASPYNYLADYTFRTYPVPSIALTTHAPVRFDGPCNGSSVPKPTSSDWSNMLDTVTTVWQSEGSPDIYYYGLVHIDCGGGCIAGIGWIGLPAAMGFDGFGAAHSGASDTHAHEVGHNHGRRHAPGCGAGGATSFPYLDSSGRAILGNAAKPNYGFDLNSKAIYTYNTYFDFMTYCDPAWVSDYTYEVLWQFDNVTLAAKPETIGQRSFLIAGSIDPQTRSATLDPVYALDLPSRWPDPGDYTLELLDRQGTIMAAYSFAANTAQPDRTDAAITEEITGFHLSVPYVDGVAGMRVKHGMLVLGTQQAKSSAPILGAPAIRSGQLSWSGREADGESLHYLVRASIDNGATWETIGLDLNQPTITLDPNHFGGQTVQVEVIASDGLNSTRLFFGSVVVPRN